MWWTCGRFVSDVRPAFQDREKGNGTGSGGRPGAGRGGMVAWTHGGMSEDGGPRVDWARLNMGLGG